MDGSDDGAVRSGFMPVHNQSEYGYDAHRTCCPGNSNRNFVKMCVFHTYIIRNIIGLSTCKKTWGVPKNFIFQRLA